MSIKKLIPTLGFLFLLTMWRAVVVMLLRSAQRLRNIVKPPFDKLFLFYSARITPWCQNATSQCIAKNNLTFPQLKRVVTTNTATVKTTCQELLFQWNNNDNKSPLLFLLVWQWSHPLLCGEYVPNPALSLKTLIAASYIESPDCSSPLTNHLLCHAAP